MSSRLLVLAVLCTGCVGGPVSAPPAKRHEAVFRVHFQGPEHRLADCGRGAEESLTEVADGALFVEPDSVLRVRVPDVKAGWHVHLFHRVGTSLAEQVRYVDVADGALALPLERFARPELLVVTSAAFGARGRLSGLDAGPGRALVPAWTLSLRLHPAGEAAARLAAQPNRYDLKTQIGDAHLVVAPLNRGDQVLTLIDGTPGAKLARFLQEVYVHWRPGDAYVVPKLLVEVADASGAVWQRAGAWPMAPRTGSDAEAYALRTPRKEYVVFGPPPAVSLALATARPETSARVEVALEGARGEEEHRLVLSHALPDGREGVGYSVQARSHALSMASSRVSAVMDAGGLPGESFPMTGAVGHRLTLPWRSPGGYLARRAPLGEYVGEVGGSGEGGPPKLHARIIATASATHYDFVRYAGAPGRVVRGPRESSSASGGSGEGAGAGTDEPGGIIVGLGEVADPGPVLVPGPVAFARPVPAGPLLAPGGVFAAGRSSGGGGSGGGGGGGGPEWCACGYGGSSCQASSRCKGTCGKNCSCGPRAAMQGQVNVKLPCLGCVSEGKVCVCKDHTWSIFDVLAVLGSCTTVTDGSGNQYPIAETDFPGAHSGTGPCHAKKKIGNATIRFWVGSTLASGTVGVFVEFNPCEPPPGETVVANRPPAEAEIDSGYSLASAHSGSVSAPYTWPALTTAAQQYAMTFKLKGAGSLSVVPIELLSVPPQRPAVSDAYLAGLHYRRHDWHRSSHSLAPETVIFAASLDGSVPPGGTTPGDPHKPPIPPPPPPPPPPHLPPHRP